MSLWNSLTIAACLLFLVLSGIQANPKNGYPEKSQNQLQQTSPEEGRGLLDTSIFRRISKFFGWGGSRRKSSDTSPLFRRPEMLPFELQYPKNRRSDYIPPSNIEGGDPFHSNIPKKWTYKSEKLNSHIGYKPTSQKTLHKIPKLTETYSPLKKYESTSFTDEQKQKRDRFGLKTSHGTHQRQFLFSDDDKQHLDMNPGKVESRKPIVTVYKNGETRQFPQNEKNSAKLKKQVHSKFALANYATIAKTINPYLAETQTKNKKHRTTKPLSHSKQNFQFNKQSLAAQKHIPHPYPFVTPNIAFKEAPKEQYDYDDVIITAKGQEPEQSFGLHRGNKIRPQKQKGLLDNMTSFASNIFGNLFSRSSDQRVKRPYRSPASKIRPPPGISIPKSAIAISSGSTISKKIENNFFDPSPQQGIIAEDAFQPIFVPSHSMDSKLPQDIMKPLIIPQKRKAEAAPEPTKPELIDFFP